MPRINVIRLTALLTATAAALLSIASGSGATPSPTYHLRIHAVLLANDDGSHPATITGSQIQTLVDEASTVWAGAGIHFDFDPAQDIESRNSTLLNNDCTIFYSSPIGQNCDTE